MKSLASVEHVPAPVVNPAFAALRARFHGAMASPKQAFETAIPSGLAKLDHALGGGFPAGTLAVLEGGCGRWAVAARTLALATQRHLAAVVDAGGLFPPGLEAAGVRLDRLVVVPAQTALGVARGADILLRSRACRVVVLPAMPLKAAVWTRLATLAHRNNTLAIVVAHAAPMELSAAAAVRVGCSLDRLLIHGTQGVWARVCGYEVHADVRKHKTLASGAAATLHVSELTKGAPLRERAFERRPAHLRAVR